jgi:nicotinate dehydrogenase subunit A
MKTSRLVAKPSPACAVRAETSIECNVVEYGLRRVLIAAVVMAAPRQHVEEALPNTSVTLRVNGKPRTVAIEPDTPLLYALRDELGLTGPKFGCGLAQCGACTVTLNGRAIRSCVTPVSSVGDHPVVTIEGLGDEQHPGNLQAAFIAEQAAQCGYCIPGMIMSSHALLASNPHPSDGEIRTALEGNLCRCGTHLRILRAVKRAARESA